MTVPSIFITKNNFQIIILFVLIIINTHLNAQKKDSTLMPYDASLAIGAGLDYGGFGINFSIYPQKNVGIFGGAGYALAGLGWNAGLKARLSSKKSNPTPFVVAMYGYNAAVYGKYVSSLDELFYGYSLGFGIDIRFKKSGHSRLSLELLIPIRSPEVQDYINSVGAKNLLPFTFSIGIGF